MAHFATAFTGDYSAKQNAIDEAQRLQISVAREYADAGQEAPPYHLAELIGKGSFGRVYKATGVASGQAVAVKIISIDEGDSLQPGASDTLADILKEVSTLKLLSDSGAKNINTVIDTLLVGHMIWIVTENCAGGSVSTLMRPTGWLAEKWIVPILREVAEAVSWVHRQGIIHRDIKCANVLITETGGVQLCDFGIAGIIETKFDKRSTLFDSTVSYGSEVDIWAFGSMAYEMATGLPSNARPVVDLSQFGSYLKQHYPRLTDDQYSIQLKGLVACCMVENPTQRPRIEQVQQHSYINNTSKDYPTHSVSKLVNAYKVWEMQGGSRLSFFSAGGAQRPASSCSPPFMPDDEWNFSAADEELDLNHPDAQVVFDVYGPDRVFDPHTVSNYDENARDFYGKAAQPPTTDLPLRNSLAQPTVRESLIDLDLSLDEGELSQFADMETIKPASRPAISHSVDVDRRRTQDWTFPSMTPASLNNGMPPFDLNHNHCQSRSQMAPTAQPNRVSALSLIDLDASFAIDIADTPHPSTTGSDAASTSPDLKAPFDLEQHAFDSELVPREPSIYVSEDIYASSPKTSHVSYSPPQRTASGLDADHYRIPRMPSPWAFPLPPSASVMQGFSSQEETKEELRRMITSLHEHLQISGHVLETVSGCVRGIR
ncbi:Serine/threonine-protein kinase [Parachaetomium inaequale]|uniref:non-specific serine/threonine protein kinase n=1 Tax=Parachaetomium inaequale TaxID=2588326 RepID=A0AAN6SVQ5_9PEZI|nr:Serine/threonine-protein kinase [Parachaetomium inaequale]